MMEKFFLAPEMIWGVTSRAEHEMVAWSLHAQDTDGL